MRNLAIALGVCLSFGILSAPLTAAQGNSDHQVMLAKAKKNKSKFKPNKAPKRHARRANRAN